MELVPPRGYDLQSTIAKAKPLPSAASMRSTFPTARGPARGCRSLVTAERILREARIEPILHFCCRDRNLIGMQADLLACAACGVRNILFVTGDPPKLGDYPQATGVFDADSIGMAAVQRRLNGGIDLGGQAIDPPTFAVIGVGLDPTALDRQREIGPLPPQSRGGHRVRHHPAGVRPRRPAAIPGRSASAGPADPRRYLAAGQLSQRLVHAERSARRGGARSRSWSGWRRSIAAKTSLPIGIEIARESVTRVRDRVAAFESAPRWAMWKRPGRSWKADITGRQVCGALFLRQTGMSAPPCKRRGLAQSCQI